MIQRAFAIGDIHGCSHTFESMLFDKIKLQKTDQLYCVGDYIDRGKDSKGVVDLILELHEQAYNIFTLRGNHEQMMLDCLIDESALDMWVRNGGAETIRSFGIASLEDLPKKYVSFFKQTQLYIETEKYIFVHAGLNFDRRNIFEDTEAMLWERDFSSQQPALKNRILIHGHTPKSLKYILNQKGNCINIDGGCVYNHLAPFGHLVAIDLNDLHFISIENGD